MIALPGGEFRMGSPQDEPERSADESPRHRVRIAPFAIGKTEVTFAQYDAFCAATRRAKPSDEGWGWADRPVINVGWEDAVAYVLVPKLVDRATNIRQLLAPRRQARQEIQ